MTPKEESDAAWARAVRQSVGPDWSTLLPAGVWICCALSLLVLLFGYGGNR